MGQLAVLPQRFAVVGGQDDQGTVRPPPFPQTFEQDGQLRVDKGDLARIRIGGVLGPERLRRVVGGMRIPEMDPAEPWPGPGRDPGDGRRNDLIRGPFRGEAHGRGLRRKGVVVDVEALIEAELRIEREGPDERRRGVRLSLEVLGQSQERCRDPGLRVLADPVEERRQAEKDVGVGGQGGRRMGERLLEKDTPGGQGIDGRRPGACRAVAAQPVGAQGVDGHEKEVRSFPESGKGQGSEDDDDRRRFPGTHSVIIA